MSESEQAATEETTSQPPPAEPAATSNDESAAEAEATSESKAPSEPPPPTPEELLAKAKGDIANLKDRLLRTAADFDNFRKRNRREVIDAEARGKETLLKELLPVFDNLERAVASAETASDAKSVADGVSMVLRQFLDTLGRAQIVRVESVGKPFDPMVHEAISHQESAEHPAGTIVVEVQPGYRLGERLVRAAMVVVAKAPPEPVADEAAAEADSSEEDSNAESVNESESSSEE